MACLTHTAAEASLLPLVPPDLGPVFLDVSTAGLGTWLNTLPSSRLTKVPDLAMLTALHSKLLFPPTRAIAACSACAA